MTENPLHITNGSHLTAYLKELAISGTYLTWQEMLCEGPTDVKIDTVAFLETRKQFLKDFYNIELNEKELKQELDILNHTQDYTEIVLWFEFDLFCHINLLAVISLLKEKNINLPLYLVCSGRIDGEKNLKGLNELNQEQLLVHYENKVALLDTDIELALTLWRIYCGKDHNLFKPYIVKKSSFIYLSSCLKAHLKRFPNLKTGLGVLEKNILSILRDKTVKSRHHLLGYTLNYQGYYGYGDTQIHRIFDKLAVFFDECEDEIFLNRKGHEALIGTHNFAAEISDTIVFGGIKRGDFYFSTKMNELIKKY